MEKVTKLHGNHIPEAVKKVLWLRAKGLSHTKIGEMVGKREGEISLLVNKASYQTTIEYYKNVQASDLKKQIDKEWALQKGVECFELADKFADKHKFYVSLCQIQKILSDKIIEKEVPKRSLKALKEEILREYNSELKEMSSGGN